MVFPALVPADEVVLRNHAAGAMVQVVLALILLQDGAAGADDAGTTHMQRVPDSVPSWRGQEDVARQTARGCWTRHPTALTFRAVLLRQEWRQWE